MTLSWTGNKLYSTTAFCEAWECVETSHFCFRLRWEPTVLLHKDLSNADQLPAYCEAVHWRKRRTCEEEFISFPLQTPSCQILFASNHSMKACSKKQLSLSSPLKACHNQTKHYLIFHNLLLWSRGECVQPLLVTLILSLLVLLKLLSTIINIISFTCVVIIIYCCICAVINVI